MAQFDIYEIVTTRIIAELEKGIIPWEKPWTGVQGGAISGSTGKPYSLLNQMLLGKPGEYFTYKQVVQRGGHVRKGEKASFVVFWKQVKVKDNDPDGNPTESLIPMLKHFNVFHIDQCEGLTPKFICEPVEHTPVASAEEVIENYTQTQNLTIEHQKGDQAYYSPARDHIVVPLREQFQSVAEYYGYVGSNDKAAYDILKGLKNSYNAPLFQRGGFFNTSLFSMETGTAEERIEQLTLAMDALKSAADYDYTDSDLYAGLSAAVKLYETYVTKLNESTSGLVKSTVTIAALESDIYGKTIDSAEAYDQYRQSIINAALADEALSAGLSDNAITVDAVTAAVDDLMATNFPEWYNQTRESVSPTVETTKAVEQYETLADALNAVKQAQDVYQNVNDDISNSSDGSISLATLSSLVNTYSDLSSVVSDYLTGAADASAILDVLSEKFNSAAEAAGYQKDIIEELDTVIIEHLATDADILIDAINEMEAGNISSVFDEKTLDDLLGKFPDLVDELNAYTNGLISAEQLQIAFNRALDDYHVDTIADGIADIVKAAETYGNESNQVVQAVQRLENAIPGLVGALYDQETGHLKVDAAALDSSKSIYDAIEATVEMERQAKKMDLSNAIAELEEMRNTALQTASSFYVAKLNIVLDRDKQNIENEMAAIDRWYDNFLTNLSDAKEKEERTSSGDPWKEEFEAEYNRRKHLIKTEQMTLKEFYDWLNGEDGYKRYYTENGEYAEEFYKYNEEVFNGLRDLYENDLDAREKALESLGDYEGSVTITNDIAVVDTNTQEIVNGYRKLIDDVEKELKKVENNPAAAEYAQSLRDRIQGYKDAIEEILADIDDFEEDWDADEHKIFLWEQAGGHEADIISQYREMQDEAHAVAEEFRKIMRDSGMEEWEIEQSPVIQNLSKLWWEYEDNIRDVFDSVIDMISDHINDIEHQIEVLEHVGGETGSTNAQMISLYNEELGYLTDQLEHYTALFTAYGYTPEQIAGFGVIQELQKSIMSCESSLKDLIDDMNDGLYDSMESLLELTVDMLEKEKELEKEGLEKQVDSYKEIIELKREMLQQMKREKSYQEDIAEKTTELAKLEAQRDTLQLAANSGDRNAALELGKLNEEIAEKQKELHDAQAEHMVEATQDALDAELKAYENQMDAQIDEIDDFLDDQNALNKAAYAELENMNLSLFNRLATYATTYTSTTRTELVDMWSDAKTAAEEYGSYVSAMNAAEGGKYYSSGNSSGSVLTGSSGISVDAQVKALVTEMKSNSLKWHTLSKEEQKAMIAENPNRKLADIIENLTGRELVLGDDGVWYYDKVGGEKVYTFHTGGVVGGDSMPTPKQDELFALLQKREVVLNETQQSNLWSMLGQLNPLNVLKNALSSFGSLRQGGATSSPVVQVDASVNIDGTMPDKQIIQILKNHPRDVANIVSREIKKF